MAVNSVSNNGASPVQGMPAQPATAQSGASQDQTKRSDPNQLVDAAVQSFLPTLTSNDMRMRSQLFDYVKQSLDEGGN